MGRHQRQWCVHTHTNKPAWQDTLQNNTLDTRQSKKGSLCSDSIYDICHDSKGNVWLGSYGQGLIHGLETPEGWIFHKYRGTHSTDRIRCIIEAKPGILLIGTTTGLVTADVRKKYIALFYTNKYRKDKMD